MGIEEQLYQELIEKMKTYHPTKDFDMVEKAYRLAVDAHKDQKRKSGEPYIIHPLKVAYILAELELDRETIIAGILHDVIEDTVYSYEDISRLFSEEIAILVDGVTKLGKLSYSTKEEIQAENYRKMFLAMAKDIRVILIKLADRLHNMRTLDFMTPAKQKEKAQETLDIYAPLAHRLGISKIRTEMEDLCFKYLNPDAYFDLETKIEKKRIERESFVNNIVQDVQAKMDEAGIKGKIEGRSKHFFSIYKKMVNQNKTLDQIYDLFAVRAIVDSVRDCYGVLGIVHTMYKPMPGRFKDYIAMPKSNMYQSLHNTLIGPSGEPFEIQIRTWEMHRTSEYGIAAHWKYKEGKTGDKSMKKEEAKLAWLRQILEWQKDMSDNKEYLDTIKLDLNIFTDQVYAFTPQGDVIQLAKGSTPIDFAYMIHSAVGNKMVGARVNNKMVPIYWTIQNGDIVEIMTSQNSKGPSRDWMKIAKSSEARSKIRQWFKKEKKEENIANGRSSFEQELKHAGLAMKDVTDPENLPLLLKKVTYGSLEEMYAAIGYGGLSLQKLIPRIREEFQKQYRTPVPDTPQLGKIPPRLQPAKASSGVIVEGLDGCLVKFARCCNPVPGDDIVGFITRGFGVSIHKKDCTNVVNADLSSDRWVRTEWASTVKETFKSTIDIIGSDRQGLLADVSVTLSNMRVPIHTFMARETKDNHSHIQVTIGISDLEQLRSIMSSLRKISGVVSVQRSNQPTV